MHILLYRIIHTVVLLARVCIATRLVCILASSIIYYYIYMHTMHTSVEYIIICKMFFSFVTYDS